MAGETTSFFANAILSGLNQGLQDRRALKEERRLMALKQQEEERLRQAALQDIEIRNSMQDKRYENILRPRALKELKENQAIKQQQLDAEREKQIGIGAMLSQEAKLPDYAYEVIAKAYGLPSLRDNTNSESKGSKALRSGNDGANARSSKGASSNLKAIKSDDTIKKLQTLKALREYRESVSAKQDELGNIIPAKISDAELYELDRLEERLVRDLYTSQAFGGEQLPQEPPNGTPTLGDARAMLFGTAPRAATNNAAPNTPTVNASRNTTTEPDVTPNYTVSLLPVTEPTLYEDVARAGEIGMRALSNEIKQGRRVLGDYYDKVSAPTTPEDYSGLSTLQKIIYKLTGKNIDPKRLEQILNKER